MDSLCLQPLFLRIMYISGKMLNVIRFAVPIILITRVAMDVYKNIINSEEKEGLNKIKNRVIAAIIVFLIPTVVGVLYSFIEKTIVNYNYSDLTVCREFANMEYIEVLESKIEQIEEKAENDERNRNLSAYEKKVQIVRELVAQNRENNANSNNESNNNDSQTKPANISGNLQEKKYSDWNYYLYVPDSAKTSEKPLVIFLHGSGEVGTNIKSLNNYGFAKYIKNGANYDTYILIPQLSSGKWRTESNRNKLMALVKKTVDENKIDTERISIIGFSLGSEPIDELININPNYFSATVLLAPCGYSSSQANIFKNIPIKIFAGSQDTKWGNSQDTKSFVDALKKINNDVEFVVFDNKPHNIVNLALSDGKVLNWIIEKKKKN